MAKNKQVIAELVTKFSADSEGFAREVSKTIAQNQQYNRSAQKAVTTHQKYVKSAKAANDANYRLSESFKRAANSSAILAGPLNGISGRLSFIASGLQNAGLAMTLTGVALAGLTMAFVGAVKTAEEYERSMLRTEALVRATGSAAGLTADQLHEQARAVALNTLASVQGVERAQQVLLTFRSVSGTVFTSAIRLSHDLAAVLGTDAKNAALQLGKALEDPAKGLTALSRAGVTFNDQEKQTILSMMKAGRVAEAQKEILKKLEQQVGGTATAEAGGLAGAVDTLSQRWDELLLAFDDTTNAGYVATRVFKGMAIAVEALTDTMEGPDTGEQLDKLYDRYAQLQDLIDNGTDIRINDQALKAEQQKIVESINAINKQLLAAGDKQRKAAQAGAAERERIAETARIKREQAQFKEGATALGLLDNQLSSQAERIESAYLKQRKQIQSLKLSEEEITRRGYGSLNELQSDYLASAKANYEDQLQALRDKSNRQIKIEQDAIQRAKGLREKARQIEIEQLQHHYATEGERVQLAYEKQRDQINQMTLTEKEIRLLGYQNMADLRADYLAQAAAERDKELQAIRDRQNQEIQSELDKQARLRLIEQDELKRKKQLERAKKMSSLSTFLGDLQALGQHSKKMAGIAKAAAISQSIINTYTAANQALAAPFPWPIPQIFAGVAVAAGLANVAAIKNQPTPSYLGGGPTGTGARVGGVDGKGGFNAILHPDEFVIDFKKHRNFVLPREATPQRLTPAPGRLTSVEDIKRDLFVSAPEYPASTETAVNQSGAGSASSQTPQQQIETSKTINVYVTLPGNPKADFMENLTSNKKRIARIIKPLIKEPH